ncbi:uncharacterized protein CG5098-like [Cydia strobilella]|uniref:uncharacterized protein CG5098-like n=1 Tax=Cydia strobilella TaxID=1100964 RepID=UPI0030078986
MSGSQHNPNGRQSQLGSSWSPLQVLQMANLLARAPQAHMASERGVTWHTPTPPPHLYHVPQPSPPDPLQAMKGAGNSVFRHTATPPELYRHTPTPPDKHLLRHTPSPSDVKAGAALPPADLYAHLGPGREKLMRGAEVGPGAYGRGVDLSLGARANGAALSVRDAPTINSLIARAPRHHRVDELLERLAPAVAVPVAAPHSVIVTARATPTPDPTPSPPSDNEDSPDSTLATKRKRKPDRTIRVPSLPLPLPLPHPHPVAVSPPHRPGEVNGSSPAPPQPPPEPPVRRKTRSGSAETIDDIAAMIASTDQKVEEPALKEPEKPVEPLVTIDKLKSVLASDSEHKPDEAPNSPPKVQQQMEVTPADPLPMPSAAPPPAAPPGAPSAGAGAAAPRRRALRASPSASTNAPVESPSEAKPAEPGEPAQPAHPAEPAQPDEPSAASFVEVENQLEKMFAGIEEGPVNQEGDQPVEKEKPQTAKARKRRKSAPTKGERKAMRRALRADTGDKKKPGRKAKDKDAYDSGSNASSGRSRGPYVQIRGPRDSPLSVSVINAATGEDEEPARRKDDFRNGLRTRGLHCSTLGLRYDATTPDATWLCVFCERGPHAAGLGDLFGPYPLDTDCDEYRALDEATRRKYEAGGSAWLHEACAVWAPGLLAAGARLWGLASAVWSCRATRCAVCGGGGAGLACSARACRACAHAPCARSHAWTLDHDLFRATCPRHTPPS